MATFNGARFIAEQLNSLATQEMLPYELVVCDDGSSDGTPEMVETFATIAPFPVRVYRNERNLGFAENFLKAARLCEGGWVAFCDQDDVWLPGKIGRVVDAIRSDPHLTLILQNALICDDNLHHEARLFPNSIPVGTHGAGSQYGFWVWPGCLQTFRLDLINLASVRPLPTSYYPGHKRMPHDKWTCLVANAVGGIRVLEEPIVLYRRHSSTLTGDYSRQTGAERVAKALEVGRSHYDFLAEVAYETAEYLRDLANAADTEVGAALLQSAKGFETIAAIQSRRAALYSATSLRARLSNLFCIAAKGGYFGPAFIALGWKSGAKDIIQTLGLLGLVRGKMR